MNFKGLKKSLKLNKIEKDITSVGSFYYKAKDEKGEKKKEEEEKEYG